MNSKSASATVVATLIVVILAIGITDGFCPFKKSSTGSTNIIQKFSGEWYTATFNNYGAPNFVNLETQCARQVFVIDPVSGSLTITMKTYRVADGSPDNSNQIVVEKVNDDPKTNTEWKYESTGAILKLQKITSKYGVYTLTVEENVYLNVLSKNAVLTEEQLAEAKKIAKANHFTGDELNRDYNKHCDKVPPLL